MGNVLAFTTDPFDPPPGLTTAEIQALIDASGELTTDTFIATPGQTVFVISEFIKGEATAVIDSVPDSSKQPTTTGPKEVTLASGADDGQTVSITYTRI